MNEFFVISNYYHNFGFNVTNISSIPTSSNLPHKELLKAPSHKWEHLIKDRQTLTELHSYQWNKAVGIGVVLGFDSLRALDIDGCTDISLIKTICEVLRLPENYPWIIRSGSHKGFHILYYAAYHGFTTDSGKIKAFKPNDKYLGVFKHVELRYVGHLVLPPSIHSSYNKYEFVSGHFPTTPPISVDRNDVSLIINHLCASIEQITQTPIERAVERFLQTGAANLEETKGSYDYLDIDESKMKLESTESSQDHLEIEVDDDSNQTDLDEFKRPYYLFFDTETTGLPFRYDSPVTELNNWPRLVQIAFILFDTNGQRIASHEFLVKPEGFEIPEAARRVHGITTEAALQNGVVLTEVLNDFKTLVSEAEYLVGHNISYDYKVLAAEFIRKGYSDNISAKKKICTMRQTTNYCKIPSTKGYKWPKLSELHKRLFGCDFEGGHTAGQDIEVTAKCFWKLRQNGHI